MKGQQSGLRKFAKCGFPAVAAVFMTMAGIGQAHALSCRPADIKASYKRWSGSEANFVIVRGTLDPIQNLPERKGKAEIQQNRQQHLEPVTYKFTGVNIQRDSNIRFESNVIVQPRCLGPWCGPYPKPSGPVVTAFERMADGKYIMQTNPCPGDFFTGNMAELEQTIRNCMKGQACKPDDRIRRLPVPGKPTTIQIR